MRLLITILIFATGYSVALGQVQSLTGFIYDHKSQLPLHGAHVGNHTKAILATTDPYGGFSLPGSVGDSVSISFVGYAQLDFIVTKEDLEEGSIFSLKPSKTLLGEVVVTPFPDYIRFKEMILEVDPVDSNISVIIPKVGPYAFYDPREAPLTQDLLAPSIGVSFDIEGLTKKGKEKKKLKKKITLEKKWGQARAKFNREWVGDITELEGDQLTDFIDFCDFSLKYILETHLIEIKDEIMAQLELFKSEIVSDLDENQYSPGS
ncbi:MAG: carboxypeptidase-like regulatory domain-containing protein [Bacteroidota bacterium]